jgi:hypothetical protein
MALRKWLRLKVADLYSEGIFKLKLLLKKCITPLGDFYAYCGNSAVDLDPLPVSRAHLTVVEPALFE